MALRLGWIVGLAAFALATARLTRLFDPGAESLDWLVVMVASALLGGVVTWMSLTYRLPAAALVVILLTSLVGLVMRLTVADTLVFGLVPRGDTFPALAGELAYALDLLRFSAPPVLAVTGLVAIVAAVAWTIGCLYGMAVARGRTWAAVLPSLGFYLYLAVLDRQPPGGRWMLGFTVLASLGLLATAVTARSTAGRARDSAGRPVDRRTAGAALAVVSALVLLSMTAGTVLAGTVPEAGSIPWRNQTGLASGVGGVSFNLFVDLQQEIVSLSDDPVFVARVSEGSPPNGELFWRLITLDDYDGTTWVPRNLDQRPPSSPEWENASEAYRGPTVAVNQEVRIEGLRQELLPALYSPVAVASDSEVVNSGLRVRTDGSLQLSARTHQGLTYRVTSRLPSVDVASLASVDGALSPLFRQAAAEGRFEAGVPFPTGPGGLVEVEPYLDLPDDLAPALSDLAREVVSGASTPFERAVVLEAWFRDPSRFSYDAEVSTGHTSLDLADWLLDPDSPNHRTGYCEQFAAAMGVMGRLVGIPTRVVMGFTPGELMPQDDGGELIVVRARNAHAWVEMWMDGHGWVRFDPTPRSDGANPATTGQLGFDPTDVAMPPAGLSDSEPEVAPFPALDPLDRLAGQEVAVGDEATGALTAPAWAGLVLSAAMVGLASVAAWKAWRRRRRLHRLRRGDITAAWEEIVDRLADLGDPVAADLTPLEVAGRTHTSLVPLANLYTQAVYGGRSGPDGTEHLEAVEAWLRRRYPTARRMRALGSLRSLLRTRDG